MKIEIVENSIDVQDEINLEQEKRAQDDKCLSQSFSEFVSDSTVKTMQITNNQNSKSNRKSKIDFKDITLFKHHSFVKIERLPQKQILDLTQKKQSSIKQPFNEFISGKAIIRPAIIKISKSKNFKTNLQKSIIGDNSEKATDNKYLDSGKSYGCSYCDKTFTKPLVMSPSWNFPARAEPGHLNFRAETELSNFFYV